MVAGDLNYSDPITQMQIETVMQKLENTSYVTSPLYSESWLRSFISYVERNNDYLNLTLDTEQDFIDALKEVRVPLFLFYKLSFWTVELNFIIKKIL